MLDKYSYDYEWDTEYCYPNSYVLKNRLNIQNQEDLSNAEREITSLKIAVAKKNLIRGKFDLAHLQKIHKYIFEDIYTWAGKLRHVNISKGNAFCLSEHIIENANRIFTELKDEHFLIGIASDENVYQRLAYYLGEINVIHPFREGNGRTQRLFIEYLAGIAGYGIDYSEISPREMIIASAEAFNCQYDKMEDIFKRSVYPLSEQEQEDNIRLFFGNDGNEMRLFHTRDDEPKMFM